MARYPDGIERVYVDSPDKNGKEITLKAGEVTSGKVWEKVYPHGAKHPSYRLKYVAGQTVAEFQPLSATQI